MPSSPAKYANAPANPPPKQPSHWMATAVPLALAAGLGHTVYRHLKPAGSAFSTSASLGLQALPVAGLGLLGYGAYRALRPEDPPPPRYPYPYPPHKYASYRPVRYTPSMRSPLYEKRAFLRGALRGYSGLAASSPRAAYALNEVTDEAARHALLGALTGGAGGYAIADEGEEGEMALRGALLGGSFNTLRGLYRGGARAADALNRPSEQLRGALKDIQAGGAYLGRGLSKSGAEKRAVSADWVKNRTQAAISSGRVSPERAAQFQKRMEARALRNASSQSTHENAANRAASKGRFEQFFTHQDAADQAQRRANVAATGAGTAATTTNPYNPAAMTPGEWGTLGHAAVTAGLAGLGHYLHNQQANPGLSTGHMIGIGAGALGLGALGMAAMQPRPRRYAPPPYYGPPGYGPPGYGPPGYGPPGYGYR